MAGIRQGESLRHRCHHTKTPISPMVLIEGGLRIPAAAVPLNEAPS